MTSAEGLILDSNFERQIKEEILAKEASWKSTEEKAKKENGKATIAKQKNGKAAKKENGKAKAKAKAKAKILKST